MVGRNCRTYLGPDPNTAEREYKAINAAFEKLGKEERREIEKLVRVFTGSLRQFGDKCGLELIGKLGIWLARHTVVKDGVVHYAQKVYPTEQARRERLPQIYR